MSDWNIEPTNPPRVYRFEVGETALFNVQIQLYYRTPCEVLERGPMLCGHCGDVHDYLIRLCDGKETIVDDPDLAKFQPPADEFTEQEEREHETA